MKARHLLWLRRISQLSFLAFFLFLLIQSRLPQRIYLEYSIAFSSEKAITLDWPVKFFFQLDPLVGLTTLLSGHLLITGFLWAAGTLILTLFLGRIFCGFICPFGTVHHLVSRIRPALKGHQLFNANQKSSSQKTKYFILIAMLMGALLGVNMAGLMDPISFLFRSIALSIMPGTGKALGALFQKMAESDIKILELMSYGAEVILAPIFGYEAKAYQTAWFIGLLFLLILFLNRLKPRFWCRVLCPLGALLGLFSRFGFLRLVKDEQACTHCGLCTQKCQGAACPEPGSTWDPAECVTCFNCFSICPKHALTFKIGWRPAMNPRPDTGRRAVLGGILAGFSIPFLGGLDVHGHKGPDPRLIRPPGAVPEPRFLTLCQRCGLCMKVCPTNVINPTIGEAGAAGFWTPRLIMPLGYCEYTCVLCGEACPTGAIKQLSIKEKIKTPVRIGSAYVDRGRCLPWSGNAPCIVCEEHCPTSPKAIYLKKQNVKNREGQVKEMQLPLVDLKRCVGCGICEYKCPVKGKPAIKVISAGETRSLENQLLLGT